LGLEPHEGTNHFAFMPLDQQKNDDYYQFGVFWLCNWFQADNNMNIFFLMNGNIFNYSLALENNINGMGEVHMQYHQTHQHPQIQ